MKQRRLTSGDAINRQVRRRKINNAWIIGKLTDYYYYYYYYYYHHQQQQQQQQQ
jgi:hypothetical protein